MTVYIPFILLKSNWIWFEKYKSEISFVFLVTKQVFYSIFHKRSFTLNSKRKLKRKWSKNEKKQWSEQAVSF